MQVLLCLENTSATEALLDYLLIHGLDAECADDIEHARRLLRFRRYDALVCDAAFSAYGSDDGLLLARVAKSASHGIRTVVLATSFSAEGQRSARYGEIDALLLKPLPLDEILRGVRGEPATSGKRNPSPVPAGGIH